MPKLTLQAGAKAGTEFSFERTSVIGRGPMADLSLDDPTISRRHAMLTWIASECFVTDLQSDNGTFVNNRRIFEPTRLKDGDLLNVGTIVARYAERDAVDPAPRSDASVRWIERAPSDSNIVMAMGADDSGADLPSFAGPDDAEEKLIVLSRRVRFLEELAKVLSQTFDETVLLSFVLDAVFDLMPQTDRAFTMLWDRESRQLLPRLARTRSGDVLEVTASRTLLDEVIRRREGVLVSNALVDQRYAEAQSIQALNLSSAISVPMIFQGEIYGVIQVDGGTGIPFGKADMALMIGIAFQVGMALACGRLHASVMKRELLERDLMLATRIQKQFLPHGTPQVNGYRFAVDYSPALAVGGDFYDFLDLGGDRVGIAVGDVSGKGVSGALYVAKLSSDLRYHSVGQTEPAEILKRLNQAFARDVREGMFVTVALLALEPESGKLVVSSAGHPLPLLRGRHGTVSTLGRVGNPPLGVIKDCSFDETSYALDVGDQLVLYTDGVTEAVNAEEEMFGTERLMALLRQSGGGVESTVQSILTAVKRHASGLPQGDDVTIVSFGRESVS